MTNDKYVDCFCALRGERLYFVTWSNNGRLSLKIEEKSVCVGSCAARKSDEAFVEKDYSYGWRGESSIRNIPQRVEILYMCVCLHGQTSWKIKTNRKVNLLQRV